MPNVGQPSKSKTLEPFWSTTDRETVRLYHGDVIAVLRQLPAKSVQCVVTSPPYWGLRDYGIEGQIGSERTPQEFVAKMVAVFREVHRVLRDDGVCWCNLGDTYNANQGSGFDTNQDGGHRKKQTATAPIKIDLAPGNLVGIPWRVALALQADGWVLRQDVIWHKPSPMPESVRNRCTKAHEYVFLLTKGQRYFYDAEAIKEKAVQGEAFHGDYHAPMPDGSTQRISRRNGRIDNADNEITSRNKRSVWTVSSQGYEGAHFATFPPKLIEPCILAGTSAKGACAVCGAPWRRLTEQKKLTRERPNDYVKRTGEEGTGNSCANSVAGVEVKTTGWEPTCTCHGAIVRRVGTRVGYGSYHDHKGDGKEYGLVQSGMTFKGSLANGYNRPEKEFETTITEFIPNPGLTLEELPVRPCIVLDPFIGSGTSCVVSLEHGRWSWGIDLSAKYLRDNAVPRIVGALQGRPALAHLAAVRKAVQVKGIALD